MPTSTTRRTFAVSATIAALVVPAAGFAQPAHATSTPNLAAPAQAEPGIAPAGLADTAKYLDATGRVLFDPQSGDAQASTAEAAMLGCTPVSGRDNPHYSGGDVSGHGWWKKGSCTAATAHVYNCLYEWYTDNSWRQKACSPKRQLKPYTGSGQRTVARHKCSNRSMTSWRNHVDVDADGQIDTAEKPMNQANVACRVF